MKGVSLLKTYCKKAVPTDLQTIERYAYEAMTGKLKRKDYSEFIAGYCNLSAKEIRKRARSAISWYPELEQALHWIALDMAARIRARNLDLPPVRYSERHDGMCRKVRKIGLMSVMQQLMEHVAVGCMEELWQAKYEYHQYASIRGKGQLKGARAIQKWTKAGKTKYFVKLDIRKCFQSVTREKAMQWLKRDIGKNRLLLWFVNELLKMHGDGLIIGSLLSQFLCNYFMSYAYRFVMGLHKERRGKSIRLVNCALFYMDDIFLSGTDRRNLVMAVRRLIRFVLASFGLVIKATWNVRRHDDVPIDMMGYVVTAKGRLKIRRRVFIRARRIFRRAWNGDRRLVTQYRVGAYYGYFKATKIHRLRPARRTDMACIGIESTQRQAGIIIGTAIRRDLSCAA
jgi:hypothetical protein